MHSLQLDLIACPADMQGARFAYLSTALSCARALIINVMLGPLQSRHLTFSVQQGAPCR